MGAPNKFEAGHPIVEATTRSGALTRPRTADSPTEKVLKQFRRFVPSEVQSAATDNLQNTLPFKVPPPQLVRENNGATPITEVDSNRPKTIQAQQQNDGSCDWSKSSVRGLSSNPPFKVSTIPANRGVTSYGRPNDEYLLSLPRKPMRVTGSKGLTPFEYVGYSLCLLLLSIILFYPEWLVSFRMYLTRALSRHSDVTGASSPQQVTTEKPLSPSPSYSPSSVPKTKGKRRKKVVRLR